MRIADLPHRQTERYLQALKGFEPHRQLLIKVGGGLLEDEAAILELTEALAELARHDIHTLLVHGGGPQLTAALQQFAVTPRFIDGKRYTDEATLKLAKATFGKLSDDLVREFSAAGIATATIPAAQLFSAKQNPELGLVGTEITAFDTESIANALERHSVLVVHSLARNEASGETLNVNADTIFRALATELKPHRIVSLTPTGGVLKSIGSAGSTEDNGAEGNDARELITGIDIRDVETLIAEGIVSGGMALKLRELAKILGGLETGSAISITKPAELLPELLTDQGSGTFVGNGRTIIAADDISDLYADLKTLIEEVFDKSLPAGYDHQNFEKIYFTADHLAFGIVTKLPGGTPYLDKLAVSPQLQGRGIGESLWYRIAADFPAIVWRSHATNRYATWYHRHADLMKRQGEWILFGRGIDFQTLETVAAEITAVPAMQ